MPSMNQHASLVTLALMIVATAMPGSWAAATPTTQVTTAPAALQQQLRRFGPYATIRRAWEVAHHFRGQGCTTSQPFHSGDGYYVDVRC